MNGIEEMYENLDNLMNDVFGIFPDASFSSWNDSNAESWQDIYENYNNHTILGKISEVT